MLLRHLRYFAALAREQHFARAAVACNVSQPTLSGAIATLELKLGTRLVVRRQRFLELTPEGRLVLDGALRLIQEEDALLQGLERLRSGLTGVLRVGVIPAAMPVVGMLIESFCDAHPAATVEIRSLSSTVIQANLHDLELDAGLTYLDNEPLLQVRCTPLYHERYLFATAAGSELAALAQIGLREAANQRLCLLGEDMQNRRILDAMFGHHQLELRPDVVSNSFLAVLSHLRTGAWSSIVPHSFVRLFGTQPDIALIPLAEPQLIHSIGLVTSDRNPLPPMASAIEACARRVDFSVM